VVAGCPTRRKEFGTVSQFLEHLTEDVLPRVLDRLSQAGACHVVLLRSVRTTQHIIWRGVPSFFTSVDVLRNRRITSNSLRMLVRRVGIEPTTYGLRVHCSAN
jgi:hypothetical protein